MDKKKIVSLILTGCLSASMIVPTLAANPNKQEMNEVAPNKGATAWFQTDKNNNPNPDDDPVPDDSIMDNYTVTVPVNILATKAEDLPNKYEVIAENVLLHPGCTLVVSCDYKGEMINHDSLDSKLTYKMKNNDVDFASKDVILSVPAGDPFKVNKTEINAVLTMKPIFAGVYEDTATFNCAVKKDYIEVNDVVPAGTKYITGVTGNTTGDYSTAKKTYKVHEAMPAVTIGDIFTDGEYEYRYGMVFDETTNTWLNAFDEGLDFLQNSWSVVALDKTKTNYGKIAGEVNGKRVEGMFSTYAENTKLEKAPKIPKTVKYIHSAFYKCTALTEAPLLHEGLVLASNMFFGCNNLITYTGAKAETVAGDFSQYKLPESLTDMPLMFAHCQKLTSAPTLPLKAVNINNMFWGCKALVKAPKIPNETVFIDGLFSGCENLSTYEGAVEGTSSGDFSKYLINAEARPLNALILKADANEGSVYGKWTASEPSEGVIFVAPGGVFEGCKKLVTAPEINLPYFDNLFKDCVNLTGTVVLNGGISIGQEDAGPAGEFDGTVKPIQIKGTSDFLNEIAALYDNVTVIS